MRKYFFVVTRCDSTKFMVTKNCDPMEVNAISASLASNNFACAYYCLEDYKDSEMFMRAILQEINFVDIHDFDSHIKKVNDEKEMFDTFYKKVEELSEKAEKDGEEFDVLLCEEVGGVYTTTDVYGEDVSKHVWVDYISIDEWGEVSVYNSDENVIYLFSKFQKTAQVEIIKAFLKTMGLQNDED